jgi:hypothetical protein
MHPKSLLFHQDDQLHRGSESYECWFDLLQSELYPSQKTTMDI